MAAGAYPPPGQEKGGEKTRNVTIVEIWQKNILRPWNVTLYNLQAIQRWRASKNREAQIKIQSQTEAERRETEAKIQHKWVEEHLFKTVTWLSHLVCPFCFIFVCSSLLRTEVERKEVAQRLEEWREQKRKIKLEAEQRLTEKIEKRRKEKVSFHNSMSWTSMNCSFDELILWRFYPHLFFLMCNSLGKQIKSFHSHTEYSFVHAN